MSAPIRVVVNRSGGTAGAMGDALETEIETAFAAAGVAIDLHLVDGGDVADRVAAAVAGSTVVVGGGDGTLGGAAQHLCGTDRALGILPLGTRNHLAHELGIPDDLAAAAKVIADGACRRIDVARVNDRVFVNNASIGLYPLMVRRREAEQRRNGLPKWLAALPAAREALRRLPHHRLRLTLPKTDRTIVTPLLFVGNNRYELGAGEVGKRLSLEDGLLSIYAVAERSRWALIGFALRAMIGRADPANDFIALGEAAELGVAGHAADIDVALDGEVARLTMPLAFSIARRSLTVIAPPATPAA